ncbi:hypothetical protein D046_8599, partial [Vibrio parahaemolyticus V-223/04]
MFTLAYVKHRR